MSRAFLDPASIGYGFGKGALHALKTSGGSQSNQDEAHYAALVLHKLYNSPLGLSEYIGESVAQIEHAEQAAKFASEEPGVDEDTILASLLHDVGHLLPDQPQMGKLGTASHERLGAFFLKGLGFSDKTAALVERHVEAKRYLCWKMPAYYERLSEASKGTLAHQGGPMSKAEAESFERDPLSKSIVAMRTWDERAKIVAPSFHVPKFKDYLPMMERSLRRKKAREDYERDGFVVLRHALDPETKARMVAWCDEIQAWAPTKGKAMVYYEEVDGKEVLCRTENFLPFHKEMRELLTQGEIMNILNDLLGEQAVLFKEKINYKLPGGGGFPPHQDAPAFTTFGQKNHLTLNIAVDAATPENGCLEVAPGYHKHGLYEQDPVHQGLTAADEAKLPWIQVPLNPGDLLLFSSWLPHRSGVNKTSKSRRALYVTYNAAGEGSFRDQYYEDKRVHFPPKIEREEGRDYSEGAKRYNVATPITN